MILTPSGLLAGGRQTPFQSAEATSHFVVRSRKLGHGSIQASKVIDEASTTDG